MHGPRAGGCNDLKESRDGAHGGKNGNLDHMALAAGIWGFQPRFSGHCDNTGCRNDYHAFAVILRGRLLLGETSGYLDWYSVGYSGCCSVKSNTWRRAGRTARTAARRSTTRQGARTTPWKCTGKARVAYCWEKVTYNLDCYSAVHAVKRWGCYWLKHNRRSVGGCWRSGAVSLLLRFIKQRGFACD
jgi:hypothetical protein